MSDHGAIRTSMSLVELARPAGCLIRRDEVLPRRVRLHRFGKPSSRAIIDAGIIASQCRRNSIQGHDRSRMRVHVAWRVAMYELIFLLVPGISHCRVGKLFNRDHSTVLHARACFRRNPQRYFPLMESIVSVLILNEGEL